MKYFGQNSYRDSPFRKKLMSSVYSYNVTPNFTNIMVLGKEIPLKEGYGMEGPTKRPISPLFELLLQAYQESLRSNFVFFIYSITILLVYQNVFLVIRTSVFGPCVPSRCTMICQGPYVSVLT